MDKTPEKAQPKVPNKAKVDVIMKDALTMFSPKNVSTISNAISGSQTHMSAKRIDENTTMYRIRRHS